MVSTESDEKDKSKSASKPKKVRVMVDNLGPKLYRKGQTTDDPAIIALLDDGTGRVARVEER